MHAVEAAGSSSDAARIALAAAGGDPAARAAFWAQHARQVHTWLWFRWSRTTLRGCIDDAAQEVYLECFRRGGAFTHFAPERARHGVTGFLRGIVRNVAHRFERQRTRERAHRAHLTGTPPPLHGDDDAVPAGDGTGIDHEHVVAALDRLDHDDPARGTPRSLRAFLRLRFDDGLPVRTIAKHWQTTPDHVHELRRRACRRFRSCLLAVLREARAPQPAT